MDFTMAIALFFMTNYKNLMQHCKYVAKIKMQSINATTEYKKYSGKPLNLKKGGRCNGQKSNTKSTT